MAGRNIVESSVTMVRDHIKANIAAALAEIRAERQDPVVTTEPPKEYFIYERAAAYRTPAVFIVADRVDMLKSAGPNAIMANVRVNISVVVDDTKEENLTKKAYRYQDALTKVLDQTELLSEDENIKLVVIVQGANFSPIFTQNQDVKSVVNAFRKEVVLECDVRHFERP